MLFRNFRTVVFRYVVVVVTLCTIVGKGRTAVAFCFVRCNCFFFVVLEVEDSVLFPSTGTARARISWLPVFRRVRWWAIDGSSTDVVDP